MSECLLLCCEIKNADTVFSNVVLRVHTIRHPPPLPLAPAQLLPLP